MRKSQARGYNFDVTFWVTDRNDDETEYRAKGFVSAYIPARVNCSNDDACPAEGGEIEEVKVWKIVDGVEIEDDSTDDDEAFQDSLEYAVEQQMLDDY